MVELRIPVTAPSSLLTTLGGGRIIDVGPGHGAHPRWPWRAWEIRLDDGLATTEG
jgi:hypothetical protein